MYHTFPPLAHGHGRLLARRPFHHVHAKDAAQLLLSNGKHLAEVLALVFEDYMGSQ